jgi:ribonuclease VapC
VIAVDTSALMSVLLDEATAGACRLALAAEEDIIISAGTLAETLIVSARRGLAASATRLVDTLTLQVIPVTEASARRVGEAYDRWGKGIHPAALNLGDCFAYEVARQHACRLLYVGGDFSRTDIESVL